MSNLAKVVQQLQTERERARRRLNNWTRPTVRLNVEENQLVNVFSEFSVCVGSLKSA
jgi:hypothetical protein